MKHLYIYLIGLLAGAACAAAQTPLPERTEADTVATAAGPYTLEECKQMALANNAAMALSERDLQAAIQLRREAFTKYFPEIEAGFSAFWTHHDILQYNVLDLFTIGLIDKGRGAGVWAMQPVFAGGRIVNGNKLARVGEEAARIRREQSADQVAIDTEGLYWQLATLKATRRTVESALAMLDTLGRQVKAAVDAGLTTRNDLLKVDLQRNGFRADLIDLDNGIRLMRMLLGQQIGLGPDAAPDIAESMPDQVPSIPETMYIPGAEALPQTADHRLLVKNVQAKELERRMEVGNYLPQVGVGAGWFYHNLFDQNQNFGGLMVSVSVPISGWWGGSHAIKRKALAVENARTELTDLSQKLQIEMADKWDAVTAAHRKMQLASESCVQSRENLRLTKAYYEAGMNTITDLLDAQTLYRKSQDEYIAAYGKFRLSQAQYLKATGRLGAGGL